MRDVIDDLRERLSLLSRTSLRIAGDLDLDTVLQETVDGARYGVPGVLDGTVRVEVLLASGPTLDEYR